MDGEQPLILKTCPKKIVYIQKLLQYDQPDTFIEKAKTYFRQEKTRPHSIGRWAEIIGSTSNNKNARNFLEKLAEENALEKEGERGNPPNKREVYTLNKQKLIECFKESSYYDWHRDLFIKTINQAEPNKKIVTDF